MQRVQGLTSFEANEDRGVTVIEHGDLYTKGGAGLDFGESWDNRTKQLPACHTPVPSAPGVHVQTPTPSTPPWTPGCSGPCAPTGPGEGLEVGLRPLGQGLPGTQRTVCEWARLVILGTKQVMLPSGGVWLAPRNCGVHGGGPVALF